MNGTDLPDRMWHKSSYSDGQSNCIEIAGLDGGRVALRDSKNPSGPALVFSADAWRTFVSGVNAADFPPSAT